MPLLRLQVILARAGIASRRAAEDLIREGSVTVNGQAVTELGAKADPEKDEITVRGQALGAPPDKVYVLLYKPPGSLTTLDDPRGRRTVIQLLPPFAREARLFPVGRLDWDTEGALLMTNDGPLSNALTHPRYGAARTYHVKVKGRIGEEQALRWMEGARLADGPARADGVEVLRRTRDAGHTWIEVTLREGRNREVKRLADAIGQTVLKLRRPIFAGLSVEGMRPGEWRLLEDHEIEGLRRLARSAGATLDESATTLPPKRGAKERPDRPLPENIFTAPAEAPGPRRKPRPPRPADRPARPVPERAGRDGGPRGGSDTRGRGGRDTGGARAGSHNRGPNARGGTENRGPNARGGSDNRGPNARAGREGGSRDTRGDRDRRSGPPRRGAGRRR